jgi:hypothetical protein
MNRIEQQVAYFRKGAKSIDRTNVLKSVMDNPELEAVVVVEPSIINAMGVRQRVNPGKVLRLNTWGRENIQRWIDEYGLSVEPYLVPKPVAEYDRFEKIEARQIQDVEVPIATEPEKADTPEQKPGFKMNFAGSSEAPPKKAGGRPKKSK